MLVAAGGERLRRRARSGARRAEALQADGRFAADRARRQFAKPKPRRDGAVRAVAFEGDGRRTELRHAAGRRHLEQARRRRRCAAWWSNGDNDGETRERRRRCRPFGAASVPAAAEPDNRYNEQITEPFGQQPVETEIDRKSNVEEDISLPPEQMTRTRPHAAAERQHRDQRCRRNESPAGSRRSSVSRGPSSRRRRANAPRPDPFVEADEEPNAGLPHVEDPTLSDEGAEAQADCTEELAKLKAHTLDQVDLSIAIAGDPGQDFPVECSIDDGTWHDGRCWDETTYMWKASALCHKPLYFEDEALERYGHSWGPCLDPLVSGAHFFCKLPVLPYCMGVTPPNECMYALGHYRPGNCAPYMMRPDADQLPRRGVRSRRLGRRGVHHSVGCDARRGADMMLPQPPHLPQCPQSFAPTPRASDCPNVEFWSNWIFGARSRNTIHCSKNHFYGHIRFGGALQNEAVLCEACSIGPRIRASYGKFQKSSWQGIALRP